MSSRAETLRIGVEFEYVELKPNGEPSLDGYLSVDSLRPVFHPRFEVVQEGTRSQVELNSLRPVGLAGIQYTMAMKAEGLKKAREVGHTLAPLASSPLYPLRADGTRGFTPTPGPRYEFLQALYGKKFDHVGKCGMHVHTSLGWKLGPDESVKLAGKIANFQHVMLALFGASRFDNQRTEDLSSSRMNRWMDLSTVTYVDYANIKTWDAYRDAVEQSRTERLKTLEIKFRSTAEDKAHDVDSGLDHLMVRPTRHGTVELRMLDTPQSATEDELPATFAGGLLVSVDEDSSLPPTPSPIEQKRDLREAAHKGMSDPDWPMRNPLTGQFEATAKVVNDSIAYIRPALEQAGVWDRFAGNMALVAQQGFAPDRQYRDYVEIHERLRDAGDIGSEYEGRIWGSRPMSTLEAQGLNLYAAAGVAHDLSQEGLAQRRKLIESTVWPALLTERCLPDKAPEPSLDL